MIKHRQPSAAGNAAIEPVAPPDVGATPLDAQWARIGGGFTVAPVAHRVDVEQLVVASARAAHADSRLFWVMASWMAEHIKLADVRRLGRLLDEVAAGGDRSPEEALASAAAGAAIDVALTLSGRAVKPLKALRQHCRPLGVPRPLFDVIARDRVLSMIAREECRPEFAAWGLWQHEISDKRDAIRSVSGILRACPELHMRSILGADLEATVMDIVQREPATASDLARRTGATRAAVHEAVGNLIARGLAVKSAGYRKDISVPPATRAWLQRYPFVAHAA
jgi:MarR family protein